jgi:hypothetical protein
MKLPAGIEKWGSGVLGVVSLLLTVNLVMHFRSTRAADIRPHPAVPRAARAERAAPRAADDLAQYDPVVNLETLKELDARPLSGLDRNPFEFVMPPASVVKPGQAVAAVGAPPVLPPPPPPVLLKPMGYNEMPGGGKQAIVSYGPLATISPDDQTFVVREGEVVMSRYKILKISPTALTVEDATTHQILDLPFPP